MHRFCTTSPPFPQTASIPACVCTQPELVRAGLTETAASERGLDIKVATTDISGWLNARSYVESTA